MLWTEAAFKTESREIDGICDRLTELGAEGISIEDEADFKRFLEENRQYWDYVDEALARRFSGVSRVKVYVPATEDGARSLALMTEALGREPETRTVDDADWQNNWKQYYKPFEVGKELLIVPEWEPIPQGGRRVLRLDPGLAFGTGSHPTTRMCLEALEAYAAPQKFVLDLGCGSGVLGIGAMVLGCAYVAGCDVDPKAPESAMHNAALNGINESMFRLYAGNIIEDAGLRDTLGSGYDIVLANIVADVIIPLAPYAMEFMAEKGVFICSGIIDGREDEVAAALKAAGFTISDHRADSGWHCFEAARA